MGQKLSSNSTHKFGLACTNLGWETLMMEIEEGPHDLYLTVLHTFLLRA